MQILSCAATVSPHAVKAKEVSQIRMELIMAVAAETNNWVLASEEYPDAERLADIKYHQFLGATAIRGEVDCTTSFETVNNSTMLAATQNARLGDEAALQTVRTNVATDVIERMFKVAHQNKVLMSFSSGVLHQNGTLLAEVNRNTLLHSQLIPDMRRRSLIELKNTLLFEALYNKGALQSHDVIVFSTTSTTMTAQEKADYGLYASTESCSIQLLAVTGQEVTLETAFVAGKKTPDAPRQDIAVIKKMAAENGALIDTNDGTDMLHYVVLIPKSDVPNGVVDIVQRYDDAAGGTFYGQNVVRQDYQLYAAECKNRNAQFSAVVDQITAQLLSEAHLFTTPLETIMRLDELSERYCLNFAAKNTDIDVMVFGHTAAGHIQDYRLYTEQGQHDRANQSLQRAKETATSGSCALFKGNNENEETGADKSDANESSGKKKMNCPFCKAKVYDDPCARVLSCWDCKALVINGKLKSKGDGGRKARVAKNEFALAA